MNCVYLIHITSTSAECLFSKAIREMPTGPSYTAHNHHSLLLPGLIYSCYFLTSQHKYRQRADMGHLMPNAKARAYIAFIRSLKRNSRLNCRASKEFIKCRKASWVAYIFLYFFWCSYNNNLIFPNHNYVKN